MWLTEFLTNDMELKPGMRVLDLGCGKAMSSVFIAREFDAKVWAADLWITATENYHTIKKHGVEDSVYPIYAEARALPFAAEYFDAIISVDAYQYFGTDEHYLGYILKFLKKGGQLGIVTPGFNKEIDDEIKERFGIYWDDEMFSLKPLAFWDSIFRKSSIFDVLISDNLPDSFPTWYEWEKELEATGMTNPQKGSDIPFLELDKGEFTCFNRIIGAKKPDIK